MKHKYIYFVILFAITSCKDNSNLFSNNNIANIEQIKKFDTHLQNNSLISDGYYHIKTGYYFLDGNLEDIQYTILELDIMAKIEINTENKCIIKYVNGSCHTPISNYYSKQVNGILYTYKENTYVKFTKGNDVYYKYFPNDFNIFLNLPYQLISNLEHAINYYSFPVPSTYIRDNELLIKENYKVNIDQRNGYLYAKYSSSYKELIHLEMKTRFYSLKAYQMVISFDKIDAFINDDPPIDFNSYSKDALRKENYEINLDKPIFQ